MRYPLFRFLGRTALALVAAVCLISVLRAAPVDYEEPVYNYAYFTKKSGKWETATNWTKKTLPGPENIVMIRDNAGASISSKVAPIEAMHLGGKGVSVLTISTGGELGVRNKIRIGRTDPDTEGLLVLDGGTLRMADAHLNVGESATCSSRGLAVFKSGTFEGGITIGSPLPNTGVGTLSIIGSAPTVQAKSKRDIFLTTPYACVEFVLDAEGVATLDFTASGVRIAKGARVRIDGAAYAGKPRNIVLIGSKIVKDGGAVIECVNFPEGYLASAAFENQRGLVLKIKGK